MFRCFHTAIGSLLILAAFASASSKVELNALKKIDKQLEDSCWQRRNVTANLSAARSLLVASSKVPEEQRILKLIDEAGSAFEQVDCSAESYSLISKIASFYHKIESPESRLKWLIWTINHEHYELCGAELRAEEAKLFEQLKATHGSQVSQVERLTYFSVANIRAENKQLDKKYLSDAEALKSISRHPELLKTLENARFISDVLTLLEESEEEAKCSAQKIPELLDRHLEEPCQLLRQHLGAVYEKHLGNIGRSSYYRNAGSQFVEFNQRLIGYQICRRVVEDKFLLIEPLKAELVRRCSK